VNYFVKSVAVSASRVVGNGNANAKGKTHCGVYDEIYNCGAGSNRANRQISVWGVTTYNGYVGGVKAELKNACEKYW
jgi:hypothetical protein